MPDTKKVKRSQIATYINIGTSDAPEWALLGIGVSNYAVSYNPQINTEKWIIHDSATSSLESNQKQGSVSQKIYKGDTCFEYINSLRDKVGEAVQTQILDIDMWDKTGSNFAAKLSNCTIAVTSYGGEEAVIEYDIYYSGDPTEGSVTVANGVPTFTETSSL